MFLLLRFFLFLKIATFFGSSSPVPPISITRDTKAVFSDTAKVSVEQELFLTPQSYAHTFKGKEIELDRALIKTNPKSVSGSNSHLARQPTSREGEASENSKPGERLNEGFWSSKFSKIIFNQISNFVQAGVNRPLFSKLQSLSQRWLAKTQSIPAFFFPNLRRTEKPVFGWSHTLSPAVSRPISTKIPIGSGSDSAKTVRGTASASKRRGVVEESEKLSGSKPLANKETSSEASRTNTPTQEYAESNTGKETESSWKMNLITDGSKSPRGNKSPKESQGALSEVTKSKGSSTASNIESELLLYDILEKNSERQRSELERLIESKEGRRDPGSEPVTGEQKIGLAVIIRMFSKNLINSNNPLYRLIVWWGKNRLEHYALQSLRKEAQAWEKISKDRPFKEAERLAQEAVDFRESFHTLNLALTDAGIGPHNFENNPKYQFEIAKLKSLRPENLELKSFIFEPRSASTKKLK